MPFRFPIGRERSQADMANALPVDPALLALVDRYRPSLQRLADYLLHRNRCRRFDASDLAQDVLLDALKCPDHVLHGSEQEQRAWLRKILLCKILNAVRDQASQKRDYRRDRSLGAVEVEAVGA